MTATIVLSYECSVYLMAKHHSSEEMVKKCMLKYLGTLEFNEWIRTRDLRKEKMRMCSICRNTCEKCILRYVGLPIFSDLRT